MSRNPQIYATRNGGRYSLLSAVSIEAEQSIGVSLPETGEYSISIPEDCDASEYETVWLKDKETGKAVDLKEGSYPVLCRPNWRDEQPLQYQFQPQGD